VNEKEFASYLDTWIPAHKQEILDFLMGLMRIPSVGTEPVDGKPFGVEVDNAYRYYLAKAEEFGMATRDVDKYAVHAEIGSGKEMAMALTHVDIVPAGSGWSKDPYGEIADEMIYGRGSQDNKGPTAACLFALKALVESGAPLKRRVRHVVGGNEESGFRCVRHYFEVEEQPTYGFSPDAAFPLVFAEKGSMNVVTSFDLGAGAGSGHARVLEFNGGERANIVAGGAYALLQVPAGQEGWIVAEMEDLVEDARFAAGGPGPLEFAFEQGTGTVKVTVKGKGAHASTPDEGTNAITGLAFVLVASATAWRSPSP
jgi:succinyl-diaminopimelate desuccinylase